jgi:hypothetical protein
MTRIAVLLLVSALVTIQCSNEPELDSDLRGTVSRYGFEYSQIRKNARESEEGLRGFLLFAGTTDGAASEAYSYELARLLEHWGEDKFLGIPDTVAAHLREQALVYLAYDGCFRENEGARSQFSERYPRLAGLIAQRQSFNSGQ